MRYHVQVCFENDMNIWSVVFLDINLEPVGGYSKQEAIDTAIQVLSEHVWIYGFNNHPYFKNSTIGEVTTIEPNLDIIAAQHDPAFLSSVYLHRL